MKMYTISAIGCCFVVLLSSFMKEKEGSVAYPDGYRQWNHIKSHMTGPNNAAAPKYAGFNHIYANDLALEGYKTGNWPDGAVIVFDVIESVENKGDFSLGKRKFIDVMEKDSKKYASTGGWGFQEFMAADKTKPALNAEAQQTCFSCHQAKAGDDLVFTVYKE